MRQVNGAMVEHKHRGAAGEGGANSGQQGKVDREGGEREDGTRKGGWEGEKEERGQFQLTCVWSARRWLKCSLIAAPEQADVGDASAYLFPCAAWGKTSRREGATQTRHKQRCV